METVLVSHGGKLAYDVLVAHNAPFDRRMLLQSGVPKALLPQQTICTWRCALHLYPEAEAHSNQVLRYYLGLKVTLPKNLPPHRALPDALVTTALVKHMLQTHTVDELVKLTTEPVLLHTVRFGQYRGKLWSKLDDGYLKWILKRDFDDDAKHTAQYWLKERKKANAN